MAALQRSAQASGVDQSQTSLPNTAIVPPVLVKTPKALTFFFARVFWTAETSPPAAPVIIVPLMAAVTASCGWYASLPGAILSSAAAGKRENWSGFPMAVVELRFPGWAWAGLQDG